MAKILIADDEKKMRHLLAMILEGSGHAVDRVENGKQALALLEQTPFDMVITDIKMPVMDGIALLKAIKEKEIPCPVVVITAFATIDSAVETMRLGAADYITKPFDSEQIQLAVERTLNVSRLLGENKRLKDRIEQIGFKKKIVFMSEQMKELLTLAGNVAQSDSIVLIQGESGTGKELIARYVHENSHRNDRRFVPVNCAAISSSLVESELFGHEKGAFTGADKTVPGKFEYASSGSLFLDEIGDLPMDTQAKLLRVLQEKKINRVGGHMEIDTDVRVICATNKNLEELVKTGEFRQDLYYRINVLPLTTPPLRKRTDDIIPLADYFIQQYDARKDVVLTDEAKQILLSHDWPGNVRELANAIERGIIMAGTDRRIGAKAFGFIAGNTRPAGSDPSSGFTLPPEGIDVEKVVNNLVKQAMALSDGNQSEAARRLNLTRSKFRVLIKQAEEDEKE